MEKNNYEKIEIERFYSSPKYPSERLASIRDYQLKDIISKNKGLIISCESETMTIKPEKVEQLFFQTTKKRFKSRYKGGQNRYYFLFDCIWDSDSEKKVEEDKNIEYQI